jgi:hypothetical protein
MTHVSSFTIMNIRHALSALCLIAVPAHAAVLVNWNLNLVNGTGFAQHAPFTGVSAASATVAVNMNTTDLLDSENVNGFSDTNWPGATGLRWSSVAGGNPSPGQLNLVNWSGGNDTTRIGNWLEFTMSAEPGYEIALETVDVRAWRNGAGAPSRWSVQIYDSGAAAWNAFGAHHNQSTTGLGTATDVTFTGAVEADVIRLRFIATGGSSTTGNLHIESFVINGTVIPEPSAALLGGLGLLALLRRRRS